MYSKYFLGCMLLAVLLTSNAEEVTKEEDCKCWENFKVEKLDSAGYYCLGEKNHRIFSCNEEKPPICKCEKDGKVIDLDLGETDCLTVDLQKGRWCHNKEEFVEYFKKHPEHATYD